MRPRSSGLLFGILLVLVGLALIVLVFRSDDPDAGSPAVATRLAGEPQVLPPPPTAEASSDAAQPDEAHASGFSQPVPDPVREAPGPSSDAPGPSSDAGCELALRVVDSPGGLAVTSFDVSTSAWSGTDARFGLPPVIFGPSREHWQHIDAADGRIRVRGLSCERPIGVVCQAPDRPAKQFGPFLPAPEAAEVELVLGGPAALLITVVDEHNIPLLALTKLGLARQVYPDSVVFQEIPLPSMSPDLRANTAHVEGLAAGHFTVVAASKWGTDLEEVDLVEGLTTPVQLVLVPDRPPGSLSVRVAGSDGPQAGVRVELGAGLSRPADFSMKPSFALTGPDGRCRFEGLAPDLYPVWLAPHEHRCVVVIRSEVETEHEVSLTP